MTPRIHRIRSAGLALALGLGLQAALAQVSATPLHDAARAGDTAALRQALAAGASANATDAWGRTPLIVALQQGRQAAVEALVEAGADVRATDAWGRTPLMVAAQMKNTAAVRLLIARGSPIDAANRNDITPLIAATQSGNADAVQALITAGASVDAEDNLGWTALMWAVYRRDEALVRTLLAAGADPAHEARDGNRPLRVAQSRGAERPLLDLIANAPRPAASASAGSAAARGKAASVPDTSRLRWLVPDHDPARAVRGSPAAPVTIYEYTEFQCPYCAHGARVVDEVMARYEGQVRLIVKHLPLPHLHPMAMPAALAFEALSLQSPSLAWRFYDRVFASQTLLAGGEAALRKLAGELGADLDRYDADVRSEAVRARVVADLKEAQAFRFDGVPAFVINNTVIEGAQPARLFFEVIDGKLRR